MTQSVILIASRHFTTDTWFWIPIGNDPNYRKSMKFVYLKLKFQKVFKNWDDNDSNLHFGYTFLIVSCNLEANLEERIKRKKGKKNTSRARQGYSDIPESLVPVTRALVSDLSKSSSEALLPGMLKCPPKSKKKICLYNSLYKVGLLPLSSKSLGQIWFLFFPLYEMGKKKCCS